MQNRCCVNQENHNWKEDYITIRQEARLEKAKEETEKVNRLLPNIPTVNISEINQLIYSGAKLVCDKIGISRRNPNRNTKPG